MNHITLSTRAGRAERRAAIPAGDRPTHSSGEGLS